MTKVKWLFDFSNKVRRKLTNVLLDFLMLCPLLFIAIIARFLPKSVDIGLGPEPLINNIHHKKALQLFGYTAETFVNHVFFITNNSDVRGDKINEWIRPYYLFALSILRYRCIYIYFNGGSLGWTKLSKVEPFLYRISGTRIVIMSYGSDVHDMSLCPNLIFKNALIKQYPRMQKNFRLTIRDHVDRWSRFADHVISGCDWVFYMWHWDTLMLAHFSIDTELFRPVPRPAERDGPIKIFHAPNHKHIKGTQFFIDAVEELKKEGFDVEILITQNVSNDEIKRIIASADIIADQLVIGWHGIFALEAMAQEKPVLCYLDRQLLDLYIQEGLIKEGEIPIINCSSLTIKAKLREVLKNPAEITRLGKLSREYVLKHHSIEAVGKTFDRIDRSIGIAPKF